MAKLNHNVSRLIVTALVFAGGAAFCGYMAWTGAASTRPLWAMIGILVLTIGGLLVECYRNKRRG